jgi:hypothetical protein
MTTALLDERGPVCPRIVTNLQLLEHTFPVSHLGENWKAADGTEYYLTDEGEGPEHSLFMILGKVLKGQIAL